MTDKPAKSRLTLVQKQVIAKRHLAGESSADIAGYAGLTIGEVRNLIKSQGMQDLMAQEKGHYDAVIARARLKLSFELPDSIDRMINRGKGADGPQIAFQADKFNIEQIMPKPEKNTTEAHVHHTFDASVFVSAGAKLDRFIDVFSGRDVSDSRYTQLGRDRIVTVGSEPEPPALDATPPTLSEPDDEPEPDTAD